MNGLPRSQLQRAAVIRRGLRDKAVLIRNRRESRMEEENEGGRPSALSRLNIGVGLRQSARNSRAARVNGTPKLSLDKALAYVVRTSENDTSSVRGL